METVVRKAFEGQAVERLTFRRLRRMYEKGCYLLRVLRGDKIDPQEVMEREAGFVAS